jgi:hypothetical protein
MPPEESLGQFLGLRNAWCAREVRLEAKPSTLVLKVMETPKLRPELSSPGDTLVVIHRHVGTSARRHVGSGRHPARERSSAMIELESPGQRCLLRATTNDQHTPRADYRNFGADSLGGGDLSLGYIPLINLLSI